MSPFALRGVIAAVLTPFTRSATPDTAKAVAYYRDLLDAGCDGLNLLGTTGEGVSVSLADRRAFMEAAARELPVERLVVGTGATALGDAVELTRLAIDLGFAAALLIPPFYYRDATDEGVARFYADLCERARPPAGRLLLYNFPRMSGILFSVKLVERLLQYTGDAIAGLKDSSNDVDLERDLRAHFPQLAIFPGSEESLAQARAAGMAGCISGSVCLWPALARAVWDGDLGQAQALADARRALSGMPLITAVRQRVARERDDESWLRSAPPL